MTKLLKQAFDQVSSLPPAEQNAFAERILHELRMDAQWDKTLEESADALAQLAADALDQHERGETALLDIKRLA